MSDKFKSRTTLRGKPIGPACYSAEPVILWKERKMLCRGICGESGVERECRACGAYVENIENGGKKEW